MATARKISRMTCLIVLVSVVAAGCGSSSVSSPVTGASPTYADTLVAFGHSVVAGAYGGFIPFPTIVGAALHRSVINDAMNGATLLGTSKDSWGGILQQTSSGAYAAVRQQPAPFRAPREIAVIMIGANDAGCLSPAYPGGAQGSAFLTAFGDSLTTVISRLRSSAVFGIDSRSASLGSDWQGVSSQAYSGAGYAATTSPGQTVTIRVPSTFPGGTVDFGTLASPKTGARWTFTVNGSPAGSLSTVGVAAGPEPVGLVQRFTHLAPGAHTILATPHAVSGTVFEAFYNYWQIEPPDPEYVGVLMEYLPDSYADYADDCGHTPTDADFDALNPETSSVLARFAATDHHVIPISIAKLNHNSSLLWTDGLHPNQTGLRYIASQVVAAMAPAASLHPMARAGAAGG